MSDDDGMRPSRVVALLVGIVMVLPSFALLLGGVALGATYQLWRDDTGFFDIGEVRLATDTAAIVAGDADFDAAPGAPDWFWSMLDTDLRVRATGVGADQRVFVGLADSNDVTRYLDGVAHDELVDVAGVRSVVYRSVEGVRRAPPPTAQPFWVESASGVGDQEFRWDVEGGTWSAVLMNADGSPGVVADVDVGVRSGVVVPIAILMAAIGGVMVAGAVALIVYGAAGARRSSADEVIAAPVGQATVEPRPGSG